MTKFSKFITGVVILLFVLGVGCTQLGLQDNDIPPQTASPATTNTATATNSEIIDPPEVIFTPTIGVTPIEMLVPYSNTSIWNTPIGPSPKYDMHSQELIASLVLAQRGKIITPDTYNYPVYFADENTPRWDLLCTTYLCAISTADGGTRTDMLPDVPIPDNAQPSPDSDGRMIIIDTLTYAEYDLWRAERLEAGWTIASGSSYNILWDGMPTVNNSRGSGIPSYAGLLRPWEILQGRIEHALAFAYTEPADDRCVFPASKTDGDSRMPFAIPEGARLQLDPKLTEADFDAMGLDRTGKVIARALQEYGMISVDHSGAFRIYLEDLSNNPYATQQWTDPNLNVTRDTISGIPYTAFRVLELPPGYWETSAEAVYHGKCLTFPHVP